VVQFIVLLLYKKGLIKVDKEFVKKKPVSTTGSIQNKIQIFSLASHIAHQWILDQLPRWKGVGFGVWVWVWV
jgi:hypothetical protein